MAENIVIRARRAGFVVSVLMLAGAAAVAQDVPRSLEMPAHRALMAVREAEALTPFESDGCSGGLSHAWTLVADRFPGFAEAHRDLPPWEGCCVVHDRAYHDAGGAMTAVDSWVARRSADRALRSCVQTTGETRIESLSARYQTGPEQVRAAYRTIAGAMYLAVRFGGGPCSGLPWRWGFGYGECSALEPDRPARD